MGFAAFWASETTDVWSERSIPLHKSSTASNTQKQRDRAKHALPGEEEASSNAQRFVEHLISVANKFGVGLCS